MRALAVAAAFGMAATLAAGCLGEGGAGNGTRVVAGVHPYPLGDGSEWPVGLRGPFKLLSAEGAKVTAADEVVLDGWIVRPDVPSGVKVPVVLWSSPYFGQCSFLPATTLPPSMPPEYPVCHYAMGDDPRLWDSNDVAEAVPVDRLVSEGYAVAIFNVRGTGNSGGCFEWFGPKEQADQALLVEWLGTQDWSNGRVAMMGLSYHGTTPWEAAVQNPPHLKTIVVAGMIGDAYTFSHTPQGATFTTIGVFDDQYWLRVSGSPPLNGPPEHYTTDHAAARAERMCPETAQVLAEDESGTFTDVRNGQYWDARRLIDRFPEVQAAVFLTHGFDDNVGSGHQAQENVVFRSLAMAPKRQLEGQWPHMMPGFDPEFAPTYGDSWDNVVVRWFDYWLKGLGTPEHLGEVEFQDGKDAWHASTDWPPAEQKEEVLYLAGGKLSPTAGSESGSFRSRPGEFPSELLCGGTVLPTVAESPALVYVSEPAAADTFVAGNPIAYLQAESDQPGGLVAVDLYDVAPDCAGSAYWGRGVADLRFHDGVFEGHDFPTGDARPVRIDVTDFAEWMPSGHRLGVVVSYGDTEDRTGQPYSPLVTLHGDGSASSSHVVVPVLEGGFGGSAPTLAYPPRPFVPPEGQR